MRSDTVAAAVNATKRSLAEGLYVDRYRTDSVGIDGLRSRDASFIPCGSWLAAADAMGGAASQPEERFRTLLHSANDVGILSEELDVESGALTGNFAQAFTHMAVV